MASQLCMAVLQKSGKLQQAKYNYLLRGPRKDGTPNAVKSWLPDAAWSAATALAVQIQHWSSCMDACNQSLHCSSPME